MDPLSQKQARDRLARHHVVALWYFAFIDNLHPILKHGVLPKNEVDRLGLQHSSFAEETVQARRHGRVVQLTNRKTCTIHDVVPVYLCPQTPTLFARRKLQSELVFLRVDPLVILDDGVAFAFTDGNAASKQSQCFVDLDCLDALPWDVIRAKYWNDLPEGRRKRNAEFLIHPCIPVSRICELGVASAVARARVQGIVEQCGSRHVVSERPDWFFRL